MSKSEFERSMNEMTEPTPPSELTESLEMGEKLPKPVKPVKTDWKTKINAIKARMAHPPVSKMPESVPSEAANLHPGVEIVPGDMGKPQTELEALVEADRQFVEKVNEENVEKASEKMLNAEALFSESLAEKSMDRERFKAVFINTVQTECAGLTREQIEESIRQDHMMLFDKRTGIQAKLAYRAELLKDATAEERAKALESDWLFKPNKKAPTEKSTRSASTKKEKVAFSPADAMRATLRAKGLTDEQITTKLAKFGL